MTYELRTRSQHAKTGKHGFHGPDTYVCVVVTPSDARWPEYATNAEKIRRAGGEVKYFGDGYAQHSGPKSALGRAIAEAEAWISSQRAEAVHA